MAIAIPAAGYEISVETFGAPVAQQVNNLTPTPWTRVATFYTNWSNWASGPPAQYRLVGDVVEMRGSLYNVSTTANILLLPVGFRPVSGSGPVRMALGAIGGINNMLCVALDINGVLTAYPATGGWPSVLFLDGFRFSILAAAA